MENRDTQYFQVRQQQELNAEEILEIVYSALEQKGYNPISQIVGYIMSGDPTYITNHRNARSIIMEVERDELVEELFRTYIQTKRW
ncbi:MAG: IreB family regulatory phosphoprotein [Lachnospiraceae bacterium]|nr:IreB family regulatory phosphoprotein [Lachnospiraceae bacterium]MDY5743005.1 IreB family regulatory phosphoprotein [Lachnospiraceae bacterium]